jgi:hypothetical protein
MMTRTGVALILVVLAMCEGLATAARPSWKALLRVPGARYLFGISAAPSGHALILYRSAQEAEGEATSGTAVLVKLGAPFEVVPLKVPPAIEDLTLPVWDRQTGNAYVLTTGGIYSVDPGTGACTPIVRGTLAGLAISPDGSRLAFWNLDSTGQHYILTVLGLRPNRNVRTWKVPTRFASDQYGHEIAFSSDGSSVFARAYDEEEQTPLEEFEINSGKVLKVWKNCLGLARSDEGIYFIGKRNGMNALFELGSNGSSPREVLAQFHFDSLLGSNAQGWIIAKDSRSGAVAVFDSETGRLSRISSGCENAGLLGQGQVVCSRGGSLFLVASPSASSSR